MSWLYLVSSVSWRATPRTVLFLRTKEELCLDMGCRKSLKLTSVRGKEMYLYSLSWWVALISRKISMKDVLRKGKYANDLAMIADKNKNYRSVGGMEGGVQEGRTDNEPGEDRRDVGLTSERT